MSTKKTFCNKYGVYFRVGITSVITLGVTGIILWALLPVYDPEAALTWLDVDEATTTINVNVELSNPNYFRGYNYTKGGFIEAFYAPKNGSGTYSFCWDYVRAAEQGEDHMYQGLFHKKTTWKFTLSYADYVSSIDIDALKSQEYHIYVSLYLTYWYKIMFWTTKTNYYQWLYTIAYLDNNLKLKDAPRPFDRTTDLILVIST